jgi:putative hydrolase of the HAD superfamily
MPLKALMVDVDGVLIVHPDPKGWSANLERDHGLPATLLQEAFFKPHWADILHGRAKLHERLGSVLSEIAPHLSADELVRYWFANDAHLNQTLLAQLAEVRSRGVEMHLATVQEHQRANYLWNTLYLRTHFDKMHYAADLGWAKPAPQFYAEIEARTGFRGNELLLIDDRAENALSARQCGWHAAQWTGEQSLKQVMQASGV